MNSINPIIKRNIICLGFVFSFLFLIAQFENMYAFVFFLIFVINISFFLEIKEFLSRETTKADSFFELLSAALTGLSNIGLFSYVYYVYGVEGSSGIIVGDFITSLYFSIVTWTTLGYGDLKPVNELRLLASLEALMGYVYMAILIGLFLNLLQSHKPKNG